MDRADVERMIRGAGCVQTRPGRGPLPAEFDCPDTSSKVRLLDAAAWWESRYDRNVRRLAVAIAKRAPSTHPQDLARTIHAVVKRRVRYLGEGLEAFQPAMLTWRQGMGDCDDSARLIVALSRALGLDAAFVVMGDKKGNQHVAPKVAGQWADATLDAAYGEHPIQAFRRLRKAGRPTRNWQPGGRRPRAERRPFYIGKPQPRRKCRALRAQAGGEFGLVDPSRANTRAVLDAAWDTVPGLPTKTPAALQAVQAIARFEGGNGEGCWERCPGVCHNWGAIQQAGSPVTHDGTEPVCPAGSAPCVDTRPNTDGTDTHFGVCFKTYDSQADGAADYLQKLLVQFGAGPVISSGNADLIASTMYANHYFGGHGADAATRISGYAEAIARSASDVANSLDESVMVVRGDPNASPSDGVMGLGMLASGALALGGAALVAWGLLRKKR